MSTEVVCALITCAGMLLSALISYSVSRATANKEIEKMRLTWEREDAVSYDDEFSEMVSSVARYIHSGLALHQQEAISAISEMQPKEKGKLANLLDGLLVSVQIGNAEMTKTFLSDVIQEKREEKGKQDAPRRKKAKK